MPEATPVQWKEFIKANPSAHILQMDEWGKLKSQFGWYSKQAILNDTGAQILFRKLPLSRTIAYIPKGPIGPKNSWKSLLAEIDLICKHNKSIFLKIEPDAWVDQEDEIAELMNGYAQPSPPIQPRRTAVISLSGGQEDWLQSMKQKTRYNVRLAARKDVTISQSNDLSIYQNLMIETSKRDDFGVHSGEYYQQAYNLFHPEYGTILLAKYGNQPLAAIMVFSSGTRAYYFYGASSSKERNRMPTYLLQFEAMKWAKEHGCETYDLWGVPDAEPEELECQFKDRSDGLWGVYRFKRGFGGHIMRSCGAFDRIYHPALYKAYERLQSIRKVNNNL
ncbi:MAG: peptidoglycan bridge formation glycyltransferase FemA/FemB family protein [Anaerolineaceae bacterium]|nr:peptidoglycan bridge formation glycyltransferase FemA/FemB family protein [Anaerolineaceae bacterium]